MRVPCLEWNEEWCCKCTHGGETGIECEVWAHILCGDDVPELREVNGEVRCTQYEDARLAAFLAR